MSVLSKELQSVCTLKVFIFIVQLTDDSISSVPNYITKRAQIFDVVIKSGDRCHVCVEKYSIDYMVRLVRLELSRLFTDGPRNFYFENDTHGMIRSAHAL